MKIKYRPPKKYRKENTSFKFANIAWKNKLHFALHLLSCCFTAAQKSIFYKWKKSEKISNRRRKAATKNKQTKSQQQAWKKHKKYYQQQRQQQQQHYCRSILFTLNYAKHSAVRCYCYFCCRLLTFRKAREKKFIVLFSCFAIAFGCFTTVSSVARQP